jgi:hypothetical protein
MSARQAGLTRANTRPDTGRFHHWLPSGSTVRTRSTQDHYASAAESDFVDPFPRQKRWSVKPGAPQANLRDPDQRHTRARAHEPSNSHRGRVQRPVAGTDSAVRVQRSDPSALRPPEGDKNDSEPFSCGCSVVHSHQHASRRKRIDSRSRDYVR